METQYNYQIRPINDKRDWDRITPYSKRCNDRVRALLLAQRLSRVFKAEVRFTEGEDPFRTSGTYINENH